MNLHRRVRRLRGKASEHFCVRCNAPAREWAQINGTDGKDPWADYVSMCISCHRRYDFTENTRAALSRAMTPERRAELSERTKQLMAEGKMGWAAYNERLKAG